MIRAILNKSVGDIPRIVIKKGYLARFFLLGALLTLSFAPFHFPGLAILSLALFYHELNEKRYQPFVLGIFFGLGFFGLGVSWVYVSIHAYGHLSIFASSFITLIFILYLALYPALVAVIFSKISVRPYTLTNALLFSALWTISEYLRGSLFSGFPWLLTGYGQFDAPLKYLLPVIGVLGISFFTTLAAGLLCNSMKVFGLSRYYYLFASIFILLMPLAFKEIQWVKIDDAPLSVGVIQANKSMRDKWDETLFWQLLDYYEKKTATLLGTKIIVMPESAIPLPSNYVGELLEQLHQQGKQAGSAILLGIPQSTSYNDSYFNALIGLGAAKGVYLKQHLVPFGEYIPHFFHSVINYFGIPEANLQAGSSRQKLLTVHHQPIAALICYEIAYGDLLRRQLPAAQWIVSVSDDGWFGHSLAIYQHLQMAQVRSLEAARYQIVANNDGLSSVIDTKGNIIASLPVFTAGILKAELFAAVGSTPWVIIGSWPILFLSFLVVSFLAVNYLTIAAKHKRRYPYQLD